MSNLSHAETEVAEAIAATKKTTSKTKTKAAAKVTKTKVVKAPKTKVTRATKTKTAKTAVAVEEVETAATEPVVEQLPTAPDGASEETTAEETVAMEVPTPVAVTSTQTQAEGIVAVNATPAPRILPRSRIEDPSISEGERKAAMFGVRFHQRFLTNMQSALLTLLDDQGRILFFVAGALRCKTGEEEDTVYQLSTVDLLRGITGTGSPDGRAYCPEVSTLALAGEERRGGWECVFRDIPFLANYLGRNIPEATSWGILSAGVDPQKRMIGHLPNGTNSEVWLNEHTWKVNDRKGPVPGSSSKSFTGRLAPGAVDYAKSFPSAWLLAVTATTLFGGMSEFPSADVVRIPSSPTLSSLCRAEVAIRAEKAQRLQERRRRMVVPAGELGVNVGDLIEHLSHSGECEPAPKIIRTA